MQVNTSFPDSTYSSSNKPSVATLKADIQAIETAVNETDTNAIRKDATVAMAADWSMGSNKITNLKAPTAATDAASIGACWPIGSVFTSVVSTNPATLLGFGTWSAIAAGKVLIGLDSGDATMDTAEETGGAKTVSIAEANIPSHTHTGPSHTHTGTTGTESATHTHAQSWASSNNSGTGGGGPEPGSTQTGTESANHTHSFTTAAGGTGATGATGSGTALNVMNPFFVVYFFKRTA